MLSERWTNQRFEQIEIQKFSVYQKHENKQKKAICSKQGEICVDVTNFIQNRIKIHIKQKTRKNGKIAVQKKKKHSHDEVQKSKVRNRRTKIIKLNEFIMREWCYLKF